MARDDAIIVSGISKTFNLPQENHNSLKGIVAHPLRFISSRRHGHRQEVLRDVSFTVKKGEFFGVLGRNGSGKSTILKILASIYYPDTGTINVKGRLLPFIELGVGFNGELTGKDNIYLSGALFGFTDEEIGRRYRDIVEFAELEPFMDQKLKNYSTGMHVRLAFSVITVLTDGDILLLDEVLAVGDASFQQKCFDYFKTLKKQKKTVVFVTHNMNAVREYCDRAVLIDGHKSIYCGKASVVAEKYTSLLGKNAIE